MHADYDRVSFSVSCSLCEWLQEAVSVNISPVLKRNNFTATGLVRNRNLYWDFVSYGMYRKDRWNDGKVLMCLVCLTWSFAASDCYIAETNACYDHIFQYFTQFVCCDTNLLL